MSSRDSSTSSSLFLPCSSVKSFPYFEDMLVMKYSELFWKRIRELCTGNSKDIYHFAAVQGIMTVVLSDNNNNEYILICSETPRIVNCDDIWKHRSWPSHRYSRHESSCLLQAHGKQMPADHMATQGTRTTIVNLQTDGNRFPFRVAVALHEGLGVAHADQSTHGSHRSRHTIECS